MLGRGLESLIPSSNNNQNNGNLQGDLQNSQNQTQDLNQQQNLNQNETPESKPQNINDFQQTKNQNLLPQTKHIKKLQEAVFHIEVSKIKPNPHQPRRDFNEESIKELAESIRQFGILQPLVVTKIEKEVPTGTEVEYQLIAGERRWLAAKYLGLETVPAIIKTIDSEKERLELAIIENIQRENLNPIETARAFARLQDEFNLTQREIASRLGKSREAIANSLRLLDLPSYIQDAIAEGKISESHGRLLLSVENPSAQQKLFEELLQSNLTTRELKRKISILSPKKEKSSAISNVSLPDPEIKILEEKLKSTLGTPVKISRDGKSGKIIIEFYSEEELKNIISKFNIGEI